MNNPIKLRNKSLWVKQIRILYDARARNQFQGAPGTRDDPEADPKQALF
jgi:hypothetical protein